MLKKILFALVATFVVRAETVEAARPALNRPAGSP
jgi:hypothetical protein